ncbi:MAG: GTPase ObgE [Bacteroidota bacterium]
MPKDNAIDHVKIIISSGKGGAGAVHFRKARFIPKGGPDGGNGGHGGSIILQGNSNVSNLLPFKYRKHIRAEDGKPGSEKNTTGANGKDTLLHVPLGTVVSDSLTGEIKAEIIQEGSKIILAKGGKGGKGNTHFKSATHQAPSFAQPGQKAQTLFLTLELKVMAEIGLVGLPNAGKSTLLSSMSAAKPQIADYPFTTINPQLGTVPYGEKKSFLMADIPGIIHGASKGKGLGFDFLKHAERTKILLFVIAVDQKPHEVVSTYYMLRNELQAYNNDLINKKHLIALSKTDLADEATLSKITQSLPQGTIHIYISALQNKGLQILKKALVHTLTT